MLEHELKVNIRSNTSGWIVSFWLFNMVAEDNAEAAGTTDERSLLVGVSVRFFARDRMSDTLSCCSVLVHL